MVAFFSINKSKKLKSLFKRSDKPKRPPPLDIATSQNESSTHNDSQPPFGSMSTSVKLTGRRNDTDIVITEQIATALKAELPRRYRLAPEMTLLYSIDQHGISLNSLYRLVKTNKGPCVLAIKDADDNIFGAYLSETLKPGTRYYGTGESFLWKAIQPNSQIKTFKWTGKNDYIILSDMESIAVGGGEGVFGLWINTDLEKGYSQTCPTFDNEQLSKKPEFDCVELEIWGFCL